jgi:hypothetical protein
MIVKRRGGNQPDDDGGAGKGNTDLFRPRDEAVHTVISWECEILVHDKIKNTIHNLKTAYAISGSQT